MFQAAHKRQALKKAFNFENQSSKGKNNCNVDLSTIFQRDRNDIEHVIYQTYC